MKEIIFDELGYFTKKQCEAIKELAEDQTYMKFKISYSCYMGEANCTLIIKTDYEETEENIKNFFIHYIFQEIYFLIIANKYLNNQFVKILY